MKVLSPTLGSGVLALRGGGPRAFVFEGQQGLSAGSPQDLRKYRLYSGIVHINFHMHWDPGQSSDSIGAHRSTSKSYRVSWGAKDQVWAHWQGKDFDDGGPKEYSLVCTPGVAIFVWRPGLTQQSVDSSAGILQIKQPTGWDHSPIHQ